MNQKDLVEKYINKHVNFRTKERCYYCGNIFYVDNVLYSYGYHYPLAIRMDDYYSNGTKYDELYLVNNNYYSSSTTGQSVLVSRSLRRFNKKYIYIDLNLLKSICFLSEIFIRDVEKNNMLFKHTNSYGIEKSYFYYEGTINLLPVDVDDILTAKRVLIPLEVQAEILLGDINNIKQFYDWYLIPTDIKIKEKDFENWFVFPNQDLQSSPKQIATRGIIIDDNIYVKRSVRYKGLKSTFLDKKIIYKAVRKNALHVWS